MFSSTQIERTVIALLGQPNRSLLSKNQLRFGNRGSLSVDLTKAVFVDMTQLAGIADRSPLPWIVWTPDLSATASSTSCPPEPSWVPPARRRRSEQTPPA